MNLIVGVSDMKISNDPDASIVTYSLGSCIGIAIYDPVVHVGGIAHYMLPDSGLDPEKARKNPYMFADTCIPRLFKSSYQLGAKKQRLRVVVAGGAQIMDQKGLFNIGKRNYMVAKKMFWRNKVIVDYEEVGGNSNRTVKLLISSGKIILKISGRGEVVI
jgi:chemotaxis protein CheD